VIGTSPQSAPVLTEDDRFELSLEASRWERRSKPRWLVGLGVAAVVAGGLFALLSLGAHAGAKRGLETQRARLADLRGLLEEKAYYEAVLGPGGRREATDPQEVLETFVRIWEETGTTTTLPTINSDSQRLTGGIRYEWQWAKTDKLQDPSLEALLEWMKRSIEEIPKLELTRLVLSPDTRNKWWRAEVVFRIWEPQS